MTTPPSQPGRRVYLLGAGFSRGFHRPMPLMTDLATTVVRELGVQPTELAAFNGDLEAWLSYLSLRQPWDGEATALRNLATFRDASAVIAQAIETASAADDDETGRRKDLLTRLVLDWCLTGTDVTTFNYDLLIEDVLRDWERSLTGADIYPLPLTTRHPAGGEGGLVGYSRPSMPLPMLYKLHGSVNWLYGGIDHGDGPITLGPWRRPDPQTQQPRDRHLYSDLTPLVIPPTSSKSPFYGNTALRALWSAAADALRKTDELIVIGYSFPASDQQVTTLIRTALPPRASIRIVTQDEAVTTRAREVFRQHSIEALVDEDAAAVFVEQSCGPVIEWSHTSDGSGVREWLTTPAGKVTRMASYAASSFSDISSSALEELARAWPSARQSWRAFHVPDDDRVNHFHAYVAKSEWEACPNPWHD